MSSDELRELIRKYVSHVVEREGTDFLNDDSEYLTDEERAMLREMTRDS